MFFGRFTAMLRAFGAVLAGVNKLDARRFMAFNALGGVAWASIMGVGAYLCGRSSENVMGPVGLGLLAFVLLGAVALWLFMRRHEARLMVAAEATIPGPLTDGLGPICRRRRLRARFRRISKGRSKHSSRNVTSAKRKPASPRPALAGRKPCRSGSRSRRSSWPRPRA